MRGVSRGGLAPVYLSLVAFLRILPERGLAVTQLRFLRRRRLLFCGIWTGYAKAERLPTHPYLACLSSRPSHRKVNCATPRSMTYASY